MIYILLVFGNCIHADDDSALQNKIAESSLLKNFKSVIEMGQALRILPSIDDNEMDNNQNMNSYSSDDRKISYTNQGQNYNSNYNLSKPPQPEEFLSSLFVLIIFIVLLCMCCCCL